MVSEQTLIVVKPDGFRRKLTGKILARFEEKGFQLKDLKLYNFNKEKAQEFYSIHEDKPFFGELLSFIMSGTVVVCILEGSNAVNTVRLMIGSTFLPVETIKKITGSLYAKLAKAESTIPGLLVIDTPCHEIFSNLRSRGGSAADIAIVVVDINKGFEPQTVESIEILRTRKVPYLIVLNKIDMISGWRKSDIPFIVEEIKKQDPLIQEIIDTKIYDVVGSLSRLGYNSEAFWRVKDFTKELAIVPVSAATGVGIPELLAVLVGLSQQYLAKRLEQ